ncbi:MAG: PEP-CTERM sorting domain-containing protein [Opitutaceae bacterium]|nr:PEP-CTERM sorting domain-containing protein [Opitutaceae bacterium]
MKTSRLLIVIMGLCAAVEVWAQLIAYDNLSGYTSGTINGQGQGIGWTGNWSTASSSIFSAVPASDLTYTGLTGATGLGQTNAFKGAGLGRYFPAVSSGTLYFGALVQYQSTYSGIRLIAVEGPGEGNSGFVSLGQYGSNPYSAYTTLQYLDARPISGDVASQTGQSSGISITTQTVYLVGKIQFNTSGTSDSIWFWVNPSSASDLQNTANYNASLINPYDIGSIGRFHVYVDHPSSGFYFDEVRVSTAAADMFGAIPEPSTYAALVGIIVLGVAAWRRRRT